MNTVLRNLEYTRDGNSYKIDIGINHEEISTGTGNEFYYRSSIEDIGDLSVFYGYNDFDFSGYTVEPGKLFPKKFDSIQELEKYDFASLYREGYTDVTLSSGDYNRVFTEIPVNIWVNSSPKDNNLIQLESVPNLVIKKDNEVKFIVINGFVHDLNNSEGKILNGLVFH
jgi:hypothetical protein